MSKGNMNWYTQLLKKNIVKQPAEHRIFDLNITNMGKPKLWCPKIVGPSSGTYTSAGIKCSGCKKMLQL